MTWLERLEEAETRARSMTTKELIETVTATISTSPTPGTVSMTIHNAARSEIVSRWIKEHEAD